VEASITLVTPQEKHFCNSEEQLCAELARKGQKRHSKGDARLQAQRLRLITGEFGKLTIPDNGARATVITRKLHRKWLFSSRKGRSARLR
jgi:hypothetical protein